MAINKIELQDSSGNILYPHTSANNVNYDSSKSVSDKIDEAIANLTTLKAGLATAVNNKNGDSSLSSTSSLTDITSKIDAIVTLSSGTNDATATASQILAGSTAYSKGSKITGTMANKGAITQALNAGGSYTIPAGYHNGSGKVTANSLASQTSATATATNILSGQTAYVNGSKITGTMPNKGWRYPAVSGIYDGESNYCLRIEDGWYGGRTYEDGDTPTAHAECYLPLTKVASSLGILADKIVSGYTIAGVTGTATAASLGGSVFTSGTGSVTLESSQSRILVDFSSKVPSTVRVIWGQFTSGSTFYFVNFRSGTSGTFKPIVWDKYYSKYADENPVVITGINLGDGDSSHTWSAGTYTYNWYAI